jgi:hypothetical protein
MIEDFARELHVQGILAQALTADDLFPAYKNSDRSHNTAR